MARRESDASFLLGAALGLFVGAAVAVILAPQKEESGAELDERVRRSQQALDDKKAQIQKELDALSAGGIGKRKSEQDKAKEAERKAQEDVHKARQEVARAQDKAHEAKQDVDEAQDKLEQAKERNA